MSPSFSEMMERIKKYDPRRRDVEGDELTEYEITRGLLSEALLIDEFTGLQNRQAFEDRVVHRAVFLEIDIQSLWNINKQYGREVGDWVMGKVVDYLWRHWAHAYRLFADKFIVEFDDEADARQFVTGLCTHLKKVRLYKGSGSERTCIIEGAGIWYGIGHDVHNADCAMLSMKAERQK